VSTGAATVVRAPETIDSGARAWCADLQVHTPRDARWPGDEPKDRDERREVAHEYLSAAQARGIEVVGITEHHDVSWIDELRHAARGLGMHLLPGFEVETQEGVHVLCLFDPGTRVVDLEDSLAALGLDQARRRNAKLTEVRSKLGFADVLGLIQDQRGGICIAAHVTSTKGLLNLAAGGARADMWKDPRLLAVQTACPPQQVTSPGIRRILCDEDPAYQRERPVACVMTSDARSLEDIGSCSTWVTMHRPSVQGLRQAFLDPESRVAFTDPRAHRQEARLLSVEWEGGYLRGTSIAFNPQLTCLIGGKGTGKSTVIESIRWAFGLEPDTGPGREAAKSLREDALQPGTKVTVRFRTAPPTPRTWTLERTAPHGPIVRDDLGEPQPQLDPTDLLLPRVYGQKEVYEVAQSTTARLGLVDGFAAEDLAPVLAREQETLKRLERNAQDVLRVREDLDDTETQLGELPGLQQWRERFRQAGFEERLRERRLLQREDQMLRDADAVLRSTQQALGDLVADLPLPPDLSGGPDAGRLPNPELVAAAADVARGALEGVEGGVRTAQAAVDRGREDLAKTREQWEGRRATRQADFDRALRELQAEAPETDPERYLDVERRLEQLEPLQQAKGQLRERLRAARELRAKLLVELQDARGDKHRRRLEAAARLTEATDDNVRVQVEYQRDRRGVLDELQRTKTGARGDALARLVQREDFTPAAFARHARARDLASTFALPEGQAQKLEQALEEPFLLRFEVLELCDGITVSLDTGEPGHPSFRELDHLSPGQKSTAVLLLILRSSEDPLIVDQPEDDLDNRFIYDDVVQRLRAAKRTRQVVVATHNANIPILGDAEQILVLEAVGDGQPRGMVRVQGTVDDPDVRAAAEHILEGGEEAFRRRREKYGW